MASCSVHLLCVKSRNAKRSNSSQVYWRVDISQKKKKLKKKTIRALCFTMKVFCVCNGAIHLTLRLLHSLQTHIEFPDAQLLIISVKKLT